MTVELPESMVGELLIWLRRQEEAYGVTAEIFEEERELTDWFSRKVAEEAAEQARVFRGVREGIESRLKGTNRQPGLRFGV